MRASSLPVQNSGLTADGRHGKGRLDKGGAPALECGMNELDRQGAIIVNVHDFGGAGTGARDDSAAIQAAVDAVADGGTILFPAGTYRVDREIAVRRRSDLHFVGKQATITGGEERFRCFFNCENCRNLTFDALEFRQNGTRLPPYEHKDHGDSYHCPIYFIEGDGLVVKDSAFHDLYSLSVQFFRSVNLTVQGCAFSSQIQTNNQWFQFVHLQTFGGANVISSCRFVAAPAQSPAYNPSAVYASGGAKGSSLTIENNHAEYCGRNNQGSHRLGVFDIYGDAQNVTVRNNVSANTMAQFMRLSATRNAQISGNHVSMSDYAEFDYSILTIESVVNFAPGQVGCQNVTVSRNKFEDLSGRAAFAVGVLSYDWGAPSTDIAIKENIFVGCRRSVLVGGPFQRVSIESNGGTQGPNSIEIGQNGLNAMRVTQLIENECGGKFDELLISRNYIINGSKYDSNAVTINLVKDPVYKGSVGLFVISHNYFRRVGRTDPGQAIAVSINAVGLQGRVHIVGNETCGFTHDWYIRGSREVVVEDNRAFDSAASPYLDDGTNSSVTLRNNRTVRR